MNKLRILSLGAGVQSSTLALMIEKGEIPNVTAGIFADVKGEPQAVYDWLNYLKTQITKFPIYIVTYRDLKKDIFDAARGDFKAFTAPFYTKNIETGKKGMLRRQCTADYKIKPVIKKIRELLGVEYRKKVPKDKKVTQIFGISYDEMARMRQSPLKYISNEYPLVTKRMRRHNCLEWIEQKGYPKPPRSACFFCPYHSNEEWRLVKQNQEEWNEAVNLDYKISVLGFQNVKEVLNHLFNN